MRPLAAALAACCALNVGAGALRAKAGPDPLGVRLRADSAVEDAALLGLGMRRLAADLGLIRLLIYYGTPEDAGVVQEEAGSHPFTGMERVEASWGGGGYPELGPRAERVLDIDPSFSYVAIYAAGALAFNLNRPDEALGVLDYGLKRDPGNLTYRSYIGAIGFHRRGDRAQVIRMLEPALAEPDCPTMIKSMVAFLYLREHRRAEAIRLYTEIVETSRDPGYRSTAARMLATLGVKVEP